MASKGEQDVGYNVEIKHFQTIQSGVKVGRESNTSNAIRLLPRESAKVSYNRMNKDSRFLQKSSSMCITSELRSNFPKKAV